MIASGHNKKRKDEERKPSRRSYVLRRFISPRTSQLVFLTCLKNHLFYASSNTSSCLMFANTVGTYWKKQTKQNKKKLGTSAAWQSPLTSSSMLWVLPRLAAKRSQRWRQQILCCFAERMSQTNVTPRKIKSRFFFLLQQRFILSHKVYISVARKNEALCTSRVEVQEIFL